MRKSGIAVAGIPGFASAFVRPVPWYSPLAAAKIERVLSNDPGTGVIRHVDAGYERAIEVAEERGVRIPMREGEGA